MKDKNWVTFHFESNQAWGLCDTQDNWLKIKEKYLEYWQYMDLTKALINVHNKKNYDFGFRYEHVGKYSLAQFAIDNNMNLQ